MDILMVSDVTFNVPWDVLDASHGFSMDMGGSVLKLLYIDKKDWVEPGKRTTDKGKIRLKPFSHAEFHEGKAYSFIKQNVYVRPREDGKVPLIYATGYMVSMNGADMKREIGVSLICLMESDCFIQAFHYVVRNLPKREVLYTIPPEEDKKVKTFSQQLVGLYSESWMKSPLVRGGCTSDEIESFFNSDGNTIKDDECLIKQKDLFPCMLGVCGSGFGYLPIYEDFKYGIADISSRGGRMWLGLGSLLTGGSNYDELMQLAAAGNAHNVDLNLADVLSFRQPKDNKDNNSDNDIYKMDVPDDLDVFTIMSMAKGENKTLGDFKKEDLARSLLEIMVADLVTTVHGSAILMEAKHVFFSGGFVEHPLTRSLIYKEFVALDSQHRVFNQRKERVYCHFLKGGQFYGAFGTLLNYKLKFREVKDPDQDKD